jgi:hypothetical protein
MDVSATRQGIVELVGAAVAAATTLEELVDCAHAAADLGDAELVEAVVGRLDEEIERALAACGAWEAELTYNKIDGWAQTGRRARLLADAWAALAPALEAVSRGRPRARPRASAAPGR